MQIRGELENLEDDPAEAQDSRETVKYVLHPNCEVEDA